MKTITSTHRAILLHLGTFGFLTTREVAMLVWHSHQPRTALKNAQAAVTALRDAGLVLARRLPYSGTTHAYVLTRAGAEVLNAHYVDAWMEADCADSWFMHGYDLSLSMAVSRHPVIALASQMMATNDLVPIGQRGLARGFLGRQSLRHFDAALLHADGTFAFGVYLAAGFGQKDKDEVKKLAAGDNQFLIACSVPKGLEVLTAQRAKARPGMDAYIRERLPAGLVA